MATAFRSRVYTSIASAKAAVRGQGLQEMSYDIIQYPGEAKYPKGSFQPVFYADGYEESEDDRNSVRNLGFMAQKGPSKELDRNQRVVFSHRTNPLKL